MVLRLSWDFNGSSGLNGWDSRSGWGSSGAVGIRPRVVAWWESAAFDMIRFNVNFIRSSATFLLVFIDLARITWLA